MDAEEYVGFAATASMDIESYTTLMAVLTTWCLDHAESDPDAVADLKRIRFTRA